MKLFGRKTQKPAPSGNNNIAETEFRELVTNLSDGVIIYTPDFRVTYMNRIAEQITETNLNKISGQEISPRLLQEPGFKTITQIIFPSLAPLVTQVSETEWPQIIDMGLDDPPLKLRITTIKVSDENGSPVTFIKVITDRTRGEAILASKKEFLDVAAHRLRTPVTAMSWAFETILSGVKNNPNLEQIASEGLSLAHKSLKIVNDLLGVARIEGGRFGYKFQEIEVVSLVKGLAEEARIIADQAGVTLAFSAPPQPIKITADPERIGIAVSNLIDNAIKYTKGGGSIAVSVNQTENIDFIKISVGDTGVGIPQNELTQIFTKFYRGSNVVQIEPNGSGLGLYITRNIVKNHGGEIFVESEVGRGTTFSFTLPTNPDLIPRKEMSYDAER